MVRATVGTSMSQSFSLAFSLPREDQASAAFIRSRLGASHLSELTLALFTGSSRHGESHSRSKHVSILLAGSESTQRRSSICRNQRWQCQQPQQHFIRAYCCAASLQQVWLRTSSLAECAFTFICTVAFIKMVLHRRYQQLQQHPFGVCRHAAVLQQVWLMASTF